MPVFEGSFVPGSAHAQSPIGGKIYCEHCRDFTTPFMPGQGVPSVCARCGRPLSGSGGSGGSSGGSSGGGARVNTLDRTLDRISELSQEISALNKVRNKQRKELKLLREKMAELRQKCAAYDKKARQARRRARRSAAILENATRELMRWQGEHARREKDLEDSFEAIRRLRSGLPAHLLPRLEPQETRIDFSALGEPPAEVRLSEKDLDARIDPRAHITRYAYEAAKRDLSRLMERKKHLEERLAALDADGGGRAARLSELDRARAEASFGALSDALGVIDAGPAVLTAVAGKGSRRAMDLAQRWVKANQAAVLAVAAFETGSADSRQAALRKLAEANVELLRLKTSLRGLGLPEAESRRLDMATNTVGALVKVANFALDPSRKTGLEYAKVGAEIAGIYFKPVAVGMAGLSLAARAGKWAALKETADALRRVEAPSWDARADIAAKMKRNEAAIGELRRLTSGYESLRRGPGGAP